MTDDHPPLRWGFIGASTIADEYMVNAVRAAGQEVVGIASGSLQRAEAFAGKHAIPFATASLDELLAREDVQAVYISSTNDRHCQQTLAAAAAGKHVLCEKPLALDLASARRMIDACRDAGVLLATNHHLRNSATHRKLRELVQSGAIGMPLFARIHHAVYLRPLVQGWRIHDAAAGGGVIRDIVVHDVDALRFVLGTEPEEAVAMTQSAYLATDGLEDGVMAVLRFGGGLLAHVHAAFTTRNAVTGFEILGSDGSLIARDVMSVQPTGTLVLRDSHGEHPVEVVHENLYARGVSLFEAALRGQGSPAATGDDGLRSLAGALAVAESGRTGSVVRIA